MMAFSKIEIRDLIKSAGAITLAFAILMGLESFNGFLINLAIAAVTVSIGFLAHELAHKAAAKHYGYWAEYRSNDPMLVIMILMSFVGLIFAAPGGVLLQGSVTEKRTGKISAAGPLASIVIGYLFLVLALSSKGSALGLVGDFGVMINAWLALFNLIPFWIFDGKKILSWNKPAYALLAGLAIGLLVLRHFLL